MIFDGNALRPLFADEVHRAFEGYKKLWRSQLEEYLVNCLVEFAPIERIPDIRDSRGRPIRTLDAYLLETDPVRGTARSFDEERARRKFLGDLILFWTGFFDGWRLRSQRIPFLQYENSTRLEGVARESYYIVSAFNVFEYEKEAPLFSVLSMEFTHVAHRLSHVRENLRGQNIRRPPPPTQSP